MEDVLEKVVILSVGSYAVYKASRDGATHFVLASVEGIREDRSKSTTAKHLIKGVVYTGLATAAASLVAKVIAETDWNL